MAAPPESRRGASVLVLGGDADGNLGDRAILHGTCVALRAAEPGVEITIMSRRPEASAEFDARVVRRGPRGFLALCRAAARSRLVLVGGGGLFQDDDSLVKMPYWALRVLLMRLLCRRVVGFSLGVGPLRHATSRWFARLAFACMREVSVRDPVAQTTAQPLTRRPVSLVPDPALLLPPADAARARDLLARHGVPLDGTPLVGVAPRRWFPPRLRLVPHVLASRFRPGAPPAEEERLVRGLARVLDRLVAEQAVHPLFLPTYTLAHEGDDRLSARILDAMSSGRGTLLRIDDPRLYRAVAALLDVMLGGRMHPAILAASAGTPVVALAYNPKFRGFFELLGRADSVIDVERFVHEQQEDALFAMVARALAEPRDAGRGADELGKATLAFARRALEGAP